MFADRFDYAKAHVDLDISAARVLAIYPQSMSDLRSVKCAKFDVLSDNYLIVKEAQSLGFEASRDIDRTYDVAIVFCPRSKQLARHLASLAFQAVGPNGRIIFDGNKTDGIEPLLKDIKKRGDLGFSLSKAHGKIAQTSGIDFSDWDQSDFITLPNGLKSKVGVFSAEGVDAGSEFLIAHLPEKLGARVADLGAGWGYLGHHLLQRADLMSLHLVEVQHTALECAIENCVDERVQFHWQDATDWSCQEPLDAIVMNPPFHVGRAADPALGQAFIRAAARNLAGHGLLVMVANRQLPYEEELEQRFQRVEEVAKNGRFKIFHASRPRKITRTRRS